MPTMIRNDVSPRTSPCAARPSAVARVAWLLAALTLAACGKSGGTAPGSHEGSTAHHAAAAAPSAIPADLEVAPVGFAPTTGAVPERLFATPGGGLGHSIARAQPSFQGAQVGQVATGDELQVIERSPDGGWYHVRHNALAGKQGWIHRDVLSLTAGGMGGGDLRRPRRVSNPHDGCELGGVIYNHHGHVWGCAGGGNWCMNATSLPYGCPR